MVVNSASPSDQRSLNPKEASLGARDKSFLDFSYSDGKWGIENGWILPRLLRLSIQPKMRLTIWSL